jgi:GT2 family glycosyltransferase
MSQRQIDAIVVTHDSIDDLRDLVASPGLREAFARVIVVDNASTDGSAAFARAAGLEVVERDNDGFGAGVNAGVAQSSAEVVAILNPDIRIDDPATLRALADHFDDPRIGAVAPALRLPDGSLQDSARAIPTPLELVVRRWGDARRGAVATGDAAAVPWAVAAFLLVRRGALERVGGLDDRFFLYFEDVDLCVRLRDAGWRVIYDPQRVLRHEHQAASRGGLRSWATRQHIRSALLFFAKHPRYALGVGNRDVDARTSGTVIAWGAHTTRADELATSVDATSRRVSATWLAGRWSAPLRYAAHSIETLGWLVRHRPRAVIVQNPPIVAPLVAYAYCRVTGARLILDSHPTSFGRKGSRVWSLFVPVHRWLARRATLVLVTVDELAAEVRDWGGRAALLHEAPPIGWSRPAGSEGRSARDRPVILFIGVFAVDEPVGEVLAAARELPEVDVWVTGDTAKASDGMVAGAPDNVQFVGYLDAAAYRDALMTADVVLALTTEPTSMVRAGYEAIYAERPLVISDWPVLRAVFPMAVHVDNTAAAIAAGLGAALDDLPRLRHAAPEARALQDRRWADQVQALRDAMAA